MTILALDTSNKALYVSLITKTGSIYEELQTNTLQHSVNLMPAIEKVLADSGTTVSDITKIIIARGPGSYTGLRIGVTVAKTLAKTLSVPLVALSSLVPLVANALMFVEDDGDYICPFFDARRSNIFTGLYQYVTDGKIRLVGKEVHTSWEEWLVQLKALHRKVIFVGVLTPEQEKMIQASLGEKAVFLTEDKAIPDSFGLVGYMDDLGEVVDPDTFVPTYLKLAEAEENWQAAHPSQGDAGYVERM